MISKPRLKEPWLSCYLAGKGDPTKEIHNWLLGRKVALRTVQDGVSEERWGTGNGFRGSCRRWQGRSH